MRTTTKFGKSVQLYEIKLFPPPVRFYFPRIQMYYRFLLSYSLNLPAVFLSNSYTNIKKKKKIGFFLFNMQKHHAEYVGY